MSSDDRDLMLRIQRGEDHLFERLVDKYRSKLLLFAANKLHDLADAEDAVQDALLSAYQARDSYDPRFAFSTWMWTILLNLCRRRAKSAARQFQLVREAAEKASVPPSVPSVGLRQLIAEERNSRLNEFLTEIPEPQADAIRLRFFAELSFQEIADAMNCSVSGAKKRVKTGLFQLAEKMKQSEELE